MFASAAWDGSKSPAAGKVRRLKPLRSLHDSCHPLQPATPAPAKDAATPRTTASQALDPNSEEVKKALSALSALGYQVDVTDLGKLNPPDEYEEELQVMAEVRAYFQVAYKVRVAWTSRRE